MVLCRNVPEVYLQCTNKHFVLYIDVPAGYKILPYVLQFTDEPYVLCTYVPSLYRALRIV